MTCLSRDLADAAQSVLAQCQTAGLMVATAESCTGGLVAASLTAIAGSSAVVDRGFVTYSNQAKAEMLRVPMALIEIHGAVSDPVARAMAHGALTHSHAHLAVAITGIAGPGGGSADKPVGLVHFAAIRRQGPILAEHRIFTGDRDEVRHQAALHALHMLLRLSHH